MSDLFGSVKMAELPPVWEGLSPVILLFVGMCLSIFPFDVWDKLWVLIRSVPEVSSLIVLLRFLYLPQITSLNLLLENPYFLSRNIGC